MTISTLQGSGNRTNIPHRMDRDELSVIADYLDVLRQFTPHNPSISTETARELEQYLALAEAALRRAGAEIGLADHDQVASKLQ